MKALEGAFNQEKALVGAFSINLKTDCETNGSFYSTNEELAKHVDMPDCFWDFDVPNRECLQYKMKKDVMEFGTHAFAYSILLEEWLDYGRWYRSKDIYSIAPPSTGYWTTKKWHLNEVFPSIPICRG